MLDRLIEYLITKQEEKLGTRLDYLRVVASHSKAAFIKLALVAPLARHRRVVPKAAHHLATIVAAQQEDCGECLQIAVNSALNDGVPSTYIRAALDGHFALLPAPLQETCSFAVSIAQGLDNIDLRASLQRRFGPEGVAELGMAIATARLFPTLKRATGHSISCSASLLQLKAA